MSTGRLKRKLGDLGVDTSSTKANETFCLIGTPLPPLEKSKDSGEFVPIWKQDVRDEKGRRRLHGAFTGGFSAGYFNTVGSKEGWVPSTFVSSRNDRAKQKTTRPEDFMDEEDLQELKDNRNIIDTTDEMDFMGGTQAEKQRREGADAENDSIASVLEASMLPAPKDSAGARILKKMGWRIGNGIGPRVSLKQRKLQDLQAFTSQALSGDDIKVADDEEEASKHMYAPRDTPVIRFDRKDNFHGLGYRPGMSLNESLGVNGGKSSSGPNLSAGFGLGALNDAEEDDLDVYDGASSLRNRVAYDIADSQNDDRMSIGASSARGKTSSRSTPGMFNDGRLILAGFVASDKPVLEDRWYALPEVPKGWKPDPQRIWEQGPEKENIKQKSTALPHQEWKTSGPSADERGAMLGETPLPSAPRSVFDYMSKKDRERLKNIASGGAPTGPTPVPPVSLTVPYLEPHIASAALRGFQPFTSDPAKQSRYTSYIQSQADPTAYPFSLKPLPSQRMDEFNKELQDYSKAAQIFKPVSGTMAGRFTSATVIDHGPKIHEGLHTPSVEEIAAKEEEERKQKEENVSPKVHAARMGMYGPMTREMKPWQPARLLCKRFGVKDPNPPPEEEAAAPTFEPPAPDASFFATPVVPSTSERRDLSNIGLGEDESQGKDTLTYERPSMDVFKAIFASDDEDSDDEKDGKKDEEDEETEATVAAPKDPIPKDPVPSQVSGPVDMSTFKPMFIPREGKEKDKEKSKEKKKRKKEKEKKPVLVSFAMEEDIGSADVPLPVKKKRKDKDKKGRAKAKDDDDAMWVEKPAPEVVKDMEFYPPQDDDSTMAIDGSYAPARGRKRAIDFM
ncbi:DUF1604-domain-containing protein [Guyanagaster necrorhizus]|uniref:DUF1604-domain-containing protein n=1 Tax=Guyanagaster necrorhizus TaxID=856835 RepID=A0A9P8ASQ8_9AGAR|nr:DUF1604-domain-containing protein [Guyanagaster necrorhizus MCA 3950]KAG7445117.1 DUF1604-domain-containing protein [Guyanagaster necrorhizus MCA 3950]